MAAGVVGSAVTVTDAAQLADLVAAAEAAARDAGPAADAAPLAAANGSGPGWDDAAQETSIGVFARLAPDLGAALRRAAQARHYGFASHEVATLWLGTSTGVRLRWVQPTGSVELNVKSPDLASSAWTGASTTDFADVDAAALAAAAARGWSGRPPGRRCPPGRYETLLPPSAVADLMIYLAWSIGGPGGARGAQRAVAPGDGTRVGERLTSLPLTLACDPHCRGPRVRAVPHRHPLGRRHQRLRQRRPRPGGWTGSREGVITELAYSRAEAAEFGTAVHPAGRQPAARRRGADGSLDDLVARTDRA